MSNIVKKAKLLLVKFFMIVALVNPTPAYAGVEWIEDTITAIFDFFFSACDGLPNFNNFTTGSVGFSLDHSDNDLGVYKNAASGVRGGKMVKVQWNTRGIQTRPRKYIVVYRIDPRFSRPQTFILRYNYADNRYDSDFDSFNNGILVNYQSDPARDFDNGRRAQNYENYFNYRGRSPIMVDSGDVINITLSDPPVSTGSDMESHAASAWTNLSTLLTRDNSHITSIHLLRSLEENKILYSGLANWCSHVSSNQGLFISNEVTCSPDPMTGNQVFLGEQNSYLRALGGFDSNSTLTLPACADGTSGPSPAPLCAYDKGRGMNISIGGTEIKSTYAPFFHSDSAGKDFFYYKSTSRGPVDFNTTIPLDNIYGNFPRLMTDWLTNPNHNPNYADTRSYIGSMAGRMDLGMQYMHMGRYIMLIDIGNSDGPANFYQQNDIRVTYRITPHGAAQPDPDAPGIVMDTQEHQSNAPQDGILWVKVDSPNTEVTGTIRVSYSYYTGSTFLSNLLYDSIALPVMNLMRETSALFYQGIAINPTWQLMVRILLTLYVLLYSVYFLAGKVQVTAYDLFVRVAKLAVVFAMFDSNSWTFFNDRVFTIFLDGMSYLAYSVSGVTSSVGNLFGFVDIIFDKYTNPTIWKILFVNLLQFYNGMIFIAILMIEAILTYLMAVLDVVVAYVMAFLTMTVLISLAPLFIMAMLFERTRSMFDNWMSLLFNYMIQPSILLIFFLLMDQLMANQFSNTAMSVCWGWLLQFNFDLDLSLIGIPLRIRFALPFLPGIPFFVPALAEMSLGLPFIEMDGELTKVAASVLMFKIYAQLAEGLIEYVTNLTAQITNVLPARKSGEQQSATNPAKAVSDQLKTPLTATGKLMKKGAKDVFNSSREGWKNPQAEKNKDKPSDLTKENPTIQSEEGDGDSKPTDALGGAVGGDDSNEEDDKK